MCVRWHTKTFRKFLRVLHVPSFTNTTENTQLLLVCNALSPHYARLNKIMREMMELYTMVRLFDWKDI
jgi:poly-beta-hydroxyalkanoate depolymerase